MSNVLQNQPDLDQTQFIEDSVFIDRQLPGDIPVTASKNNNKLFILGGLSVMAFLLISSLLLMMLFKPKDIAPEDISVEVASETQPVGPIERQLMILERDIENADPLESALSFPPVDFELSLQDATLLLQK